MKGRAGSGVLPSLPDAQPESEIERLDQEAEPQ